MNKKKYVKKTLELSDKIIVLSEEWKEYFKKLVNESKIIVLYNAIVIPNEFKKDFESKNILFLGRIGERKGIFDLLKVIKELINDYQDIKLYVGGDGEVERLKKFILDNKLEKNVEYIGYYTPNSETFKLLDKKTQSTYPSDEVLDKCEIFTNLPDDVLKLYSEEWTKVTGA